jgi:hypothetical protein
MPKPQTGGSFRECNEESTLRRIRVLTLLFIGGLAVSGVTAIPLVAEADMLARVFPVSSGSVVSEWIERVRTSLHIVQGQHPFLFYGTDWLAFGHFAIAIAFMGALRDPARNRWLFDFGLIACALVIPYALVFGAVRGIPVWWRLIDCSFGALGSIPLVFCTKWVRHLERGSVRATQI